MLSKKMGWNGVDDERFDRRMNSNQDIKRIYEWNVIDDPPNALTVRP